MSVWDLFINLVFNPHGNRSLLWERFCRQYTIHYKRICAAYDEDFNRRMNDGNAMLPAWLK